MLLLRQQVELVLEHLHGRVDHVAQDLVVARDALLGVVERSLQIRADHVVCGQEHGQVLRLDARVRVRFAELSGSDKQNKQTNE